MCRDAMRRGVTTTREERGMCRICRNVVKISRATFMATRTDIVARSDAQRANARTAATLARHCPPETPNVKPGEEIVREGRDARI